MNNSTVLGGCLCGAVRYQVSGDPLVSGICHCATCRKTTSTAALPFLTLEAEQFSLTKGSLTAFTSSPGITRSFCTICGSPLTYRTERHPTLIDIMTGSLDDPERFPPTHHLWMSHKLNWDCVADGLPNYPTSRPK